MEQNMLKVEEVETDTEQFKITDLKECDETDWEEDFEYDDKGVKVRWNKETEGWDILEPYCVECGRPEGDCEVSYFTIENEVFICCECDKPECYGKHCSETEGLKLCIGWNRNYCLDNKRFTENLFCDYCEKTNCYTDCVWCGENYKLTDMEFRCGGGFAHKDAYGNACMFCKECVAIIEKRLEC